MFLSRFKDDILSAIRDEFYNLLDELRTTDKDVVAMTRARVGSINFDAVKVDELPPDERKELLASAYAIVKEPAFEYVINQLAREQVVVAATSAEERDDYLCSRFSINGISLVDELLRELSARHEALLTKPDFDKESVI